MTEKPTLWRDMTPEEKGALLLAYHDDEPIECYDCAGFWFEKVGPVFYGSLAYRIKPEPKRETVVLAGRMNTYDCWSFGTGKAWPSDTHLITFDTIDGKPDPSSIKIEEL